MKSQIKNSPSAETPVASKAVTAERQMEPTPRPWHVDSNGDILDERSLLVARPQHHIDAALIVQCVNSFEEMKEAILDLADEADNYIGYGWDTGNESDGLSKAITKARAALAKVEQQQAQI